MRRIADVEGARFVTARKLLREPELESLARGVEWLVIDALDEVSSAREGDAVDEVLSKLTSAGRPRFVLSCRIADWRSALGASSIAEDYGTRPIELHLQPFDQADAERFLAHMLSPERAKEVAGRVDRLGPKGFLGNPQTLLMVEAVAEVDELPSTRGELFERAMAELRHEHSDIRVDAPLARLDEATALEAAGAACAILLLTGREAVSRSPSGRISASDVHVGEVASMPGGSAIEVMLGSRLFQGSADGRFVPIHRTAAEHLAARWLGRHADTPRKRRRLLTLLRQDGRVPASLRGLHAWLARDPSLAEDVIAADPLGVVVYGDADRLSLPEGQALLTALHTLEARDPYFRLEGATISMRGVVRAELLEDLRRIIRGEEAGFGLRSMILEALQGSPVTASLVADLRTLLLDPRESHTLRRQAGEALASMAGSPTEWPSIIDALLAVGDDVSSALAVDMLSFAGFDRFDDRQIATVVMLYGGRGDRERSVGHSWRLRQELPDARIEGVLDLIACAAEQARTDKSEGHPSDDLTDVVMTLIARRLKLGPVDPLRLWAWLEPFDGDRSSSRRAREEIAAWLQGNDEARRAIQHHVLFEALGDRSVWQRGYRRHSSVY